MNDTGPLDFQFTPRMRDPNIINKGLFEYKDVILQE